MRHYYYRPSAPRPYASETTSCSGSDISRISNRGAGLLYRCCSNPPLLCALSSSHRPGPYSISFWGRFLTNFNSG